MIGELQGEFEDLDNKNLKKNIQKCQSQISRSTKDHFAGENEVCEISQTHKKGCEITSQQKADFAALQSRLSACDAQLPTCSKYRETSRGNPQHCTKRLRNHLATKGWFRSVVQNSSFSLEWSACNGCNSFISIRITYRLKNWIVDFLSFETTYSM